MIVLLNRAANGGRAGERWEAVRPALERRWLAGGYQVVTAPAQLARHLAEGVERVFVAAGGDGTMNLLLEHVLAHPARARREWMLGAIGLGSSNDVHKPLRAERVVGGVPVLLDAARPVARSVGQVELVGADGRRARRHFLLNASLGITAAGNDLFNGPGGLLRLLKRHATTAAIWYATVRAVVAVPDLPAELEVAGQRLATAVTNLSFLLSPHFTGSLRYDLAVPLDGGELAIALCERLGLGGRIRILRALAAGRFSGLPGTRVFRAPEAKVALGRAAPLELDGEVLMARSLEVRVLRQAVNLCS